MLLDAKATKRQATGPASSGRHNHRRCKRSAAAVRLFVAPSHRTASSKTSWPWSPGTKKVWNDVASGERASESVFSYETFSMNSQTRTTFLFVNIVLGGTTLLYQSTITVTLNRQAHYSRHHFPGFTSTSDFPLVYQNEVEVLANLPDCPVGKSDQLETHL